MAEELLCEVERRVAITPRRFPKPDTKVLAMTARFSRWQLPDMDLLHALGTDAVSRKTLKGGVLYPCQAIFLGQTVPLLPLAVVVSKSPECLNGKELTCWPGGSSDYSLQADSVWQIFFSFYNGQLFRILVTYDQDATHGLTAEDMVQAISTKYGTATRTAGEISFPTNELYRTTEQSIFSLAARRQ
jgi:hypothetical protein